MNIIKPQTKQEFFLRSNSDICFYGGAAGGGKTFALLLDALYGVGDKNYRAVIFRKTLTQVTQLGGLWDESQNLYRAFNANPTTKPLRWKFPSGAEIGFSYLEHENDKFKYQGAQLSYIGFDELTHFTESQFMYMLSRTRSAANTSQYIRATLNPDADSWVKNWIKIYLDENETYHDPKKIGKKIYLYSTKTGWNITEKLNENEKYLTIEYIFADAHDNRIMLENNPDYIQRLKSMALVDRERLLYGNWAIKPAAGTVFKAGWFDVVDETPLCDWYSRGWDFAATESTKADFTASVLIGKKNNDYYIIDITQDQLSANKILKIFSNISKQDKGNYENYFVSLEQDPGAAGKYFINQMLIEIEDVPIYKTKVMKDKILRALPISAAAEQGRIHIVKNKWNLEFINNLINFPHGKNDDIIDAMTVAYNKLIKAIK